MRLTLILGITACVLLASYFLARPTIFDEPQPIATGETQVQRIRSDDGEVEHWTYTRKEYAPESAESVASVTRSAPTGAATLLNEQALNAWNTGDIRTAIELFEQAIVADPADPEPLSNYGRRLTLMVDYNKAQPLLIRASQLNPDDPQVWLDLLTLYEKSLQFQKANDARKRAKVLAGDRTMVRNPQGAWLLDGDALL